MYALMTNIKIKSDQVSVFMTAMLGNAQGSLDNEVGCLQFSVNQDPLDVTKVYLYEIYASEHAFQLHHQAQHFLNFVAIAKNCFAEDPEVKFVEAVFSASTAKKDDWIDITMPLHNNMVHWPDNPPFEVERIMKMEEGAVCNLSRISMGMHSGTHMDAPLHFIKEAADITTFPFDAGIGKVRIVAISNPLVITKEELMGIKPQMGERLFFKTKNSEKHWTDQPFNENAVYICGEAAEYLVECQIQTVGIDYLSVGNYHHDTVCTHDALLAKIWIIEGLNLVNIEPGTYDLICMPLKIVGCEASPVRAIIKKIVL